MAPEPLKLLNPRSPRLDRRGSGKPELTWEDVSGALAMMSREVSLYARIVYLNEDQYRWKLIELLAPKCRKLGYDKSQFRLIQMLFLAFSEARRDNRCPLCNGIGQIGIYKCEKCSGAGVRRPSLKSRADAMQMDPRNFKRRWQYKYERYILPTFTDLDVELQQLNHKIGR